MATGNTPSSNPHQCGQPTTVTVADGVERIRYACGCEAFIQGKTLAFSIVHDSMTAAEIRKLETQLLNAVDESGGKAVGRVVPEGFDERGRRIK